MSFSWGDHNKIMKRSFIFIIFPLEQVDEFRSNLKKALNLLVEKNQNRDVKLAEEFYGYDRLVLNEYTNRNQSRFCYQRNIITMRTDQ